MEECEGQRVNILFCECEKEDILSHTHTTVVLPFPWYIVWCQSRRQKNVDERQGTLFWKHLLFYLAGYVYSIWSQTEILHLKILCLLFTLQCPSNLKNWTHAVWLVFSCAENLLLNICLYLTIIDRFPTHNCLWCPTTW